MSYTWMSQNSKCGVHFTSHYSHHYTLVVKEAETVICLSVFWSPPVYLPIYLFSFPPYVAIDGFRMVK